MKKLDPPDYDDDSIAKDLSLNTKLKYAYPILKDHLDTVLSNYETYINQRGNPWDVPSDSGLPIALDEELKRLYGTPPNRLDALAEMRGTLSVRVCPMCGGFGNGTLDHYLPQTKYPQYSILTKNLIPACSCNSLRKEGLKGGKRSERVLHPYYDDCLKKRSLSVLFSDDFNAPLVSIINCYPRYGINYKAIQCHIDKIINRTNIENWMVQSWASLYRTPRCKLDTLPKKEFVTGARLRVCIDGKMKANDIEFGTPNNWNSTFFHGLLKSPRLLEWLVTYINDYDKKGVAEDCS